MVAVFVRRAVLGFVGLFCLVCCLVAVWASPKVYRRLTGGHLIQCPVPPPAGPDDGSTALDIWYGPRQEFGTTGRPSERIDILGNVVDNDGVESLHASLNGEPFRELAIGKDCRRLAEPGDFIADFLVSDLRVGDNVVELLAIDSHAQATVERVQVVYGGRQSWPLPYSVRWAEVTDLQQAAQVVDGKWLFDPDGVRTAQVGYDRLLNIGDASWDDYEILVPLTLRSLDAGGFVVPSGGPGLGVIMRWRGHYDDFGDQPFWGFQPIGAIAWHRWPVDLATGRSQITDGMGLTEVESDELRLTEGSTYWLRAGVETTAEGAQYQLKFWPADEPEPAAWTLEHLESPSLVDSGSLLLVAHHVDVVFGDIEITPR